MAIFSKLILGCTILSSFALAAPFDQGKPEWTVTKTDYTTLDFTATIYIDDSKTATGGSQPTFAPQSISTSAPLETSSPIAVPSAPAPTITVPSTTVSTSTTPAASPADFFTTSSAPAPAAASPAAITTSSPRAPAAAPAVNGDASAPSSASDSATCEGTSDACEGDITYYGGGLGACGTNVDPTGNGIALPVAFMGPLSNTNPYCGMALTIYNPATGISTQAVVMDKCEGCTGRSIDLTPNLFSILTNNDLPLGRVSGVEWWFS